MKKTVIVVVGPTASGKSGLGIELAKKLNGVIISADSMQIYKNLDVGTAKVTSKEAMGIKHELIDILDVTETFSVSDYKRLCYEKIEEVLNYGKTPIIVGGTGLYINAVVNNMSFDEVDKTKDMMVNQKLEEMTQRKSQEEIYDLLKSLDCDAARNIDKKNTKRVLRAIKMYLLGNKKSDVENKNDLWYQNESPYNFFTIYIDMPRDLLYYRINQRVDMMVEEGILDEVNMLHKISKVNPNITACQAIGYKEFFAYVEGKSPITDCVELLKQKTRNYAKRQVTWFKKLQNKFVVDGTKSKEEMVESILKEYYEKNKC